MTSTKNRDFDPPSLCPQASSWARPPPIPCGRPHAVDMKSYRSLLKRLIQWPSGPTAEIWIYDCNLFKTVLLVTFITDLYRPKMTVYFYSVQRQNSGKFREKTPTSFHEKWTLILIFCVDVTWQGRSQAVARCWVRNTLFSKRLHCCPFFTPPPSTCVYLSHDPLPFRVDVINGWPLMCYSYTQHQAE